MKKIFISVVVAALTMTSCERDISALNENPKSANIFDPNYGISGAEIGIVNAMATPSVNTNNFRFFTQQMTETQYVDEARYNLLKRNVADRFWALMYSQINKAELSKNRLTEIGDTNKTKMASLEALQIYAFSVLVDTYGDVPYSKAIDIENNPNPAYDDALSIYKDLLKRIDAVNASLQGAPTGFTTDKIFNGNPVKISKFLNAVKLRIAVTLADVEPALAKAAAESAYTDGLPTSNADNIGLTFDVSGLYTSPLYQEMVSSGRNDFVPADTFVEEMNDSDDPRRSFYFTKVNDEFRGGKYGVLNTYSDFSHVNEEILIPNYTYNLIEHSEVEFMLAEAASKGFNVGSVGSHYDAGIRSSMNKWKVPSEKIEAYMQNNSYAATSGTDKEKIGKQAWIATFNRGFEAWGFSRRLDFKTFKKPFKFDVPVRLPYPVKEGSVNNDNRTTAVVKQFGNISRDVQGQKLFWDKY